MTTRTDVTTPETLSETEGTVSIRAHTRSIRRMGHWTTARRFDVRASSSSVILELRSPRIESGDIEINLDLPRAMVRPLVPEGAIVDDSDLRRVGRCGLVDWGGVPAPGGRVIRVVG